MHASTPRASTGASTRATGAIRAGAGIGERPRAAPAAGIDAYVWIKPPGESDGSSSLIPNDEGKGFDAMCAPGNPGNPRNNNSETGALPNAPLVGPLVPGAVRRVAAQRLSTSLR